MTTMLGLFRPGGLGDGLLLAPTLRVLRREHPRLHIHCWTPLEAGQILLHAGLVDSIDESGSGLRFSSIPGGKMTFFVGWGREWRGLCQTAALLGVPHITGGDQTAPAGQHQTRYLHESVGRILPLGDAPDYLNPLPLPPAPPALRRANRRYGGAVLLHPGGSYPAKLYPLPWLLRVGRALQADGARVVVVQPVLHDAGDTEEFETISRPLRDLADLMRDAALYIGSDTGTTHLAGQMGCPTIALFGPTQPVIWGPVGPRVAVLQRCERVLRRTSNDFCRRHACFARLGPDEVTAEARRMLATAARVSA